MNTRLPLLLVALLLPASISLPKPKEGPTAHLLRRLNGVWETQDHIPIRVEIRRNLNTGDTLYFYHRETYMGRREWHMYEKLPYRAHGGDRIHVPKTGTTYRITFTLTTMIWRTPGEKGARVWKRLHRLPGEKASSLPTHVREAWSYEVRTYQSEGQRRSRRRERRCLPRRSAVGI